MRDNRPNNEDDQKAGIKATWASLTPQWNYMPIPSMSINAVIRTEWKYMETFFLKHDIYVQNILGIM